MRYLSSKNVAEILGINISTLKRWTDNGSLECTKLPVGTESSPCKTFEIFIKIKKLLVGTEN